MKYTHLYNFIYKTWNNMYKICINFFCKKKHSKSTKFSSNGWHNKKKLTSKSTLDNLIWLDKFDKSQVVFDFIFSPSIDMLHSLYNAESLYWIVNKALCETCKKYKEEETKNKVYEYSYSLATKWK